MPSSTIGYDGLAILIGEFTIDDKSDDTLNYIATSLIVGIGVFHNQQATLDVISLDKLFKHLNSTLDMFLDQCSIF